MPTVLRVEPYRFFFYAGDTDEPEHVHIERDDSIAKFWLEPVQIDRSLAFGRAELNRTQRLVLEHKSRSLEAWHDYFNG